jgi:hypothetical protein
MLQSTLRNDGRWQGQQKGCQGGMPSPRASGKHNRGYWDLFFWETLDARKHNKGLGNDVDIVETKKSPNLCPYLNNKNKLKNGCV